MRKWLLVLLLAAAFTFIYCEKLLAKPSWRTLSEGQRRQRLSRVPKELLLYRQIFGYANAAVVNISTLQVFPAAKQNPVLNPRRKNLGSGSIIRSDGLILTNYHVVRNEQGMAVLLATGELYRAKLIGGDIITDIALIKIEGEKPFATLPFGVSKSVKIGDMVFAFGNPFGFNNTMTHGIVSAIGRVISADQVRKRFDNFIQTDASINPGNSGGPLVNVVGEIVGINTAMTAKGAGVAFAIPVDEVKGIIEKLIRYGRVPRGWLGLVAREIEEGDGGLKQGDGLVVLGSVKGSPARKAGLKKEDRIVRYNGIKIRSLKQLSDLISDTLPDTEVEIEIYRKNRRRVLKLKTKDLPPKG